jgi:PDZ domain/Carboxypeptidase regulatory-like domain
VYHRWERVATLPRWPTLPRVTSPPTLTPAPSRRRSWFLAGGTLVAALFSLAALRALERSRDAALPVVARDATLHVKLQSAGRPVAGAQVELRGRGDTLCDGESAADGSALLEACAAGPGVLYIEAKGFVRVRRAHTLAAGENQLDQPLTAAARLLGRVLDDREAPLGGARVRVRLVSDAAKQVPLGGSPDDEVWSATSGADGNFVIDTLPQGVVSVQVELAPYESVTLPDLGLPAIGPVSIVLQRMAAVAGRVLGPAQQPLAAVPVSLAGSGVWPPRNAQSDASGEFRFGTVPPGVYEVRAEQGELVSAPLEGVAVEPGQEVRIELSLGPGRTLRGSVRDAASGAPLAGARIRVAEDALSGTQKETQSRGDGAFELPGLRLLDQRVQVELAGYVAIEARWSASDPPLRAALLRAGTLRGRVENDTGHGVDAAELEVVGQTSTGSNLRLRSSAPLIAESSGRLHASTAPPLGALSADNLGVTQGVVPPIPLVPGSVSGAALGGTPGFRSGPTGDFELTGIPPGEFRVLGRKPGFVMGASASVRLAPGGKTEELRVVLGGGGRLVGRVLDSSRQPLSEIRVGLSQSGEATRWTLTDPSGNFEFSAVQGRCSVVAALASSAGSQVEVDVPAGGVKKLDIIVETTDNKLVGRVFDTTGAPVSHALIKLEVNKAKGQLPLSALSKADGTFELEGLPTPPYSVRAEHSDYAPSPSVQVADASKAIELLLDAGESLSGSVIDATSHDPLAGVRLTLQRGNSLERAHSNREGAFKFERVARGAYQLWAEVEGHLTLGRAIEIAGPQGAELEIALEAAGSVSGEVVDRLGRPVWNAEVAAGDPPDWARATRSDHTGHFLIGGLRAGAASLSARKGAIEGGAETRVHEGVDSPGVVVRFDEVVPEEDEPDEVKAQKPIAQHTEPEPEPEPEPGAPPLALGRRGDQVVVARVAKGSPAERLGLRVGDVVTAINGEQVHSPAQAKGMLGLMPGVSGWVIDVRREGAKLRLRYFPR